MRITVALCVVLALCAPGAAHAAPAGQITWGVHVAMLEPAFLNSVGPRVAVHGLGSVGNFPYSSKT